MRGTSLVSKLVMLTVIIVVCLIFFSLVGYGLAILLFDLSLQELQYTESYKAVQGMKLVQVFSSIGTYLLPVFLFIYIQKQSPVAYLKLKSAVNPMLLLLVALIVLTFFPINGLIAEWNASLPLPKLMTGYEDQIENTIKRFLEMPTLGDLMVNLFVIALVAGLAEEVLFRGMIQQLIMQKTNNPTAAIFITAALFSAIHFQFSGFFPRFLLGALFGYLFFWGKSLWYPIIGHVIHNGTTVVLVYFYGIEAMEGMGESAGSEWLLILGSTVIFAGFVLQFYRRREAN